MSTIYGPGSHRPQAPTPDAMLAFSYFRCFDGISSAIGLWWTPISSRVAGTDGHHQVIRKHVYAGSWCQTDEFDEIDFPSPCTKGENFQFPRRTSYFGPDLPEEIWQLIHSLMPLQDAARAACISHAFLSSWRQHPNLTLTMDSLGCIDFTKRVKHILKNHTGVGVKKLDIECWDANDCKHLDNWLQIVVTPLLEELTLTCHDQQAYAFQSTVKLRRLESLTRLHLHHVHITGDELGCFLSGSLVLERLSLGSCNEIACLKIPGILNCLSYLHVYGCLKMEKVDNKAQNLHTIYFRDFPALYSPGESLQLGELLQLKTIDMRCNNAVNYARAELPSIALNLETLTMASMHEMFNAPRAPSKFLHLKYLRLNLEGVFLSPAYDYFILAAFIDASPSLQTFILNLPQQLPQNDCIFGGSSDMRPVPEHQHHKLQSIEITGFGTAKSLVELTCYILGSATSLECITLDTTTLFYTFTCTENRFRKCFSMPRENIKEARTALSVIETYIKSKVPATVKLNVVEPCRRCHTL